MELFMTPRNSQLPIQHIPPKHSHGLWSKNHDKSMKYQKAIWEKWLPEIKSNRFKQTKKHKGKWKQINKFTQ